MDVYWKKPSRKTFYYLATFLFSLVYIVPMWMVVVNSLKDAKEANLFGVSLPSSLKFDNYRTVFESANVGRAFANGMILSVGSVVLILVLASLASFAIARSRRRSLQIYYYIFIVGLIVPVAFIPTYLVLDKLYLLNTYTGLVLVSATFGLPMSIFLYAGFIRTIPSELDEAGIIDGCRPLALFFRIIFPLLKPVTMTLLIFNFVGSWNDIQIPLFFANGDKWGLPLTVYNFYGSYLQSWNLIFADILMTVFPLLLLYILAQRHIISGMTAGAVKG
ncbi:carbohydrate ABC transporter permease [Cohnella sp. GCM10020058]|uniref:carbohydrate ABC transporter permease n=1 Tax=Cohnella sp. GCM10020058 TaxID=3317330 RepID=UPI003631B24C